MPEVDSKLAQSLRQAKATPMRFVFVAKGSGDGALLVGKSAIPPKDVKEAKERCGGTTLLRGRCLTENGVLIFEMGKEPPAMLAGQLRKVIIRDAGLTLRVETRFAGGLEQEEGAHAEGEDKAAPPDAAAFKARLQAVMPTYQRAAQQAPTRKAELDALAARAAGAARGGDFAGGLELLGQLESAATAALSAPTATTPPVPDGAAEAFKARLRTVLQLYQEAIGKAPGQKDELSKLAAEAGAAGKTRDFAAGLDLLDRLEARSRAALRAAEAKAEVGTAPVSKVVFTQTRLAWDQTRKKIQAELQKLEQAILEGCADQDDFDAAGVASGAKSLYTILDKLDTRLIDKLDEALNAEDADRQRHLKTEAGQIVQEYLVFVNSDPLMAEIDANGFTPVAVRQTAVAALKVLASKL